MGGNKNLRQPSSENHLTVQSAKFQGPIPPPSILKGYGEIIPNAPERILAMAESQSAHRQELEKIVVKGDNIRANRGQIFGFIVVMVAMFGGFYLVGIGKDSYGIASIIGSLVTLAGAFLYGSISRKREREKKLVEARK